LPLLVSQDELVEAPTRRQRRNVFGPGCSDSRRHDGWKQIKIARCTHAGTTFQGGCAWRMPCPLPLRTSLVERASQRARDALYAAPRQYAAYMASVLGFEVPASTLDRYVESKATRDLYVHGNGTANSIYISKAGKLARAKMGDVVPFDHQYLQSSIGNMKQMFSAIYKGMLDKFGESEEIERAFNGRASVTCSITSSASTIRGAGTRESDT
jgi:hypothetical protein